MPKATWNNASVAESDATEVVEGNHYFPPDSLNREYVRESDAKSVCGWKGTDSYYDVVVDGVVYQQAAWYYPDPKPEANKIKEYVAFWKGVKVED